MQDVKTGLRFRQAKNKMGLYLLRRQQRNNTSFSSCTSAALGFRLTLPCLRTAAGFMTGHVMSPAVPKLETQKRLQIGQIFRDAIKSPKG